jgi:hypothetical protein
MTKKLFVYSFFVLAIVSCSNSKSSSSERYPSEYRDNFLSSCELNAESYMTVGAARDYCECVLGNLEASMSLEEMLKAEQAMMAGESSNLDMEELASGCV